VNQEKNLLSWQVEISLINNRFIIWNVVKGSLLSLLLLFVILGLILGFTDVMRGLKTAFIACLWTGLFIVFISIFTLLVVLGNKYPLEFIINEEGIIMKSQSRRAKAAHRLAFILGLLGKSSAAMASGALGKSGEIAVCGWKEIDSVKLYPDKRVVAARQNFIQTMYVFCTESNFQQVANLIKEKSIKNK